MTFIFYDTEDTGLEPAFDQIVQFAAIITDDDLSTIEEVNRYIRLSDQACLTVSRRRKRRRARFRASFFSAIGWQTPAPPPTPKLSAAHDFAPSCFHSASREQKRKRRPRGRPLSI